MERLNTRFFAVLFAVVLLSCAVSASLAGWVPDGTAICTAPYNQPYHVIASDGLGGAIVAWKDYRSNTDYDIYAQRVDATGAVLWTTDGVALCTAAGDQDWPCIISDGGGGAIVAWQDERGGDYDIYAQRVDASGTVLWTANGEPICTAENLQIFPQIAPDGAGGAIVTWELSRSGNHDIYAQRVDASGNPLWTIDGKPVCAATGSQYYPAIVPDGAGGAVITWDDTRSSTYRDIYAQRLNASGGPLWTVDGVALCTATDFQLHPAIVSDGAGGAIVVWADERSGNSDIYARRIDGGGTPLWTADGVAICSETGTQEEYDIVQDGAGGAIIAWQDDRNGNDDVYAQRVDASGAVQWIANGKVICDVIEHQRTPTITTDTAGGAIISWHDKRLAADIYAQRIDDSGDSVWEDDGVPLCAASGSQTDPVLASDGVGGAIVAWKDYRSGSYSDIYGARVCCGGAVTDVPGGSGGSHRNALFQNYPNPFRGGIGTTIQYSVARAGRAEIHIFDVAGRMVNTIAAEAELGDNFVAWNGKAGDGRKVASGVYFYQIKAGEFTGHKKMLLIR